MHPLVVSFSIKLIAVIIYSKIIESVSQNLWRLRNYVVKELFVGVCVNLERKKRQISCSSYREIVEVFKFCSIFSMYFYNFNSHATN